MSDLPKEVLRAVSAALKGASDLESALFAIIDASMKAERERCRIACIDQAGRHAAYESGRAEANAARACAKVIMGADPYDAFRETQ